MNRLWCGALTAAMAAALSSCQPPLEWYKAGVAPSDYKADVTYCEGARDLVPAYTPDNLRYEIPLNKIETYNNCMRSRGYQLIEPGTEPRPYAGQDTMQGKKQ